MKQCIVCYENKEDNRMFLHTNKTCKNHHLCLDCFFKMTYLGEYKCPLCRKSLGSYAEYKSREVLDKKINILGNAMIINIKLYVDTIIFTISQWIEWLDYNNIYHQYIIIKYYLEDIKNNTINKTLIHMYLIDPEYFQNYN